MCFSTKVKTETPAPSAPTIAGSLADQKEFAKAQYELGLQYNPQLAAQDFALSQEYAPKYQQLMQQTEASAYPYTAGLQEQLAKRASEGIGGSLTDQMEQSYRDMLRSEIGPNVGSGIGADYVSRGMVDATQQYQRYYDDLGLSLTGRLPLSQAQNPQFRTAQQLADPNAIMGFNQGNYGTQASIFNNMYNAQATLRGTNNAAMAGLLGGGIAGGSKMGAAAICWVASELYGGWFKPQTVAARYYVVNEAPSWFRNAYIKYGERIAAFIKDKPVIKSIIKPLFDFFAKKGGYRGGR